MSDFRLLMIFHLECDMPDEHARRFQFNGEGKPLPRHTRNKILLLLDYISGLLLGIGLPCLIASHKWIIQVGEKRREVCLDETPQAQSLRFK